MVQLQVVAAYVPLSYYSDDLGSIYLVFVVFGLLD